MSNPSNQFANILPELEEVRENFLRLVETIPEDVLDHKFPGEGWTIKQELVHIVQAVAILPKGIKRAVVGKNRSALSFIPTNMRSWFNGFILIPLASRRATRASIVEAYGQAFNTLLNTLREVPEEAWHKGAAYPRQYRTVEQMAHRPAEHFEEHAAHLCRLLNFDRKGNQYFIESRRG
ncbi:MAG TPA: DinB family protein [Anaerolineales bacterium]|nr:DinB family protein [Anaerolineales bacterium]